MNPRMPTVEEVRYWTDRDRSPQRRAIVGGPEEGDDVIPCPALIGYPQSTDGHLVQVVHVPYELDEIELAALARGGTLWLTTFGGLPIHLVEVVRADQ